MQWRNEQIYHLRQAETLTTDKQDAYFENVVVKLFDQEHPDQILFSFIQNDKCVGYGGLVHVNWLDRNAEVSFLLDTNFQKSHFNKGWRNYLWMLDEVAFKALGLHKLYTYAFDIRPHLYPALEASGYIREAELKEHCLVDGDFKDVIIHKRIAPELIFRNAVASDLDVTYSWTSNQVVRKYALQQDPISFNEHQTWFNKKLVDPSCIYTLVDFNNQPVGSYRLDIDSNGMATISYLLDPNFHGKGLGTQILQACIRQASLSDHIHKLVGWVKPENVASIHLFRKFNFTESKIDQLLKFELNINEDQ